MKAGVFYKEGDIRFDDFADPVCGDDDVIIKVKAAGICGSDPPRILNLWKYPRPQVPGHEFAGTIAEVGKNVKNFKLDDAVVAQPLIPCRKCENCEEGHFSMCNDMQMLGADLPGGFAQYVRVPATNIQHIECENLEEAALIEPCAVALYGVLGIRPEIGDTVAILGCGTIGQLVLQWFRLAGVHRIIAVDISKKKLEEAKALGADICINGMEQDTVEAVLEATHGKGVDIAMETAGSKITQEQCLLVTKKRGRIGYLGIARSDILLKEKSFESIFRHELTLRGFWNSYGRPFPGPAWVKSIRALEDGKIQFKPLISHRFPLEKVSDAFQMIKERKEEYNKILFVMD